jgi:hypothetical protein
MPQPTEINRFIFGQPLSPTDVGRNPSWITKPVGIYPSPPANQTPPSIRRTTPLPPVRWYPTWMRPEMILVAETNGVSWPILMSACVNVYQTVLRTSRGGAGAPKPYHDHLTDHLIKREPARCRCRSDRFRCGTKFRRQCGGQPEGAGQENPSILPNRSVHWLIRVSLGRCPERRRSPAHHHRAAAHHSPGQIGREGQRPDRFWKDHWGTSAGGERVPLWPLTRIRPSEATISGKRSTQDGDVPGMIRLDIPPPRCRAPPVPDED